MHLLQHFGIVSFFVVLLWLNLHQVAENVTVFVSFAIVLKTLGLISLIAVSCPDSVMHIFFSVLAVSFTTV